MSVILQFSKIRKPLEGGGVKPCAPQPGGVAEIVIFPGIRVEREVAAKARDEAVPDKTAREGTAGSRSLGGADD